MADKLSESMAEDIVAVVHDLRDKTATLLGRVKADQAAITRRMDDFEVKSRRPNYSGGASGGGARIDLAEKVFEDAAFKSFSQTQRGRIAVRVEDMQTLLQTKAVTQADLGFGTSGVFMPERVSGIIPAALRTYRLRQLLRNVPTSAGMVDFVKVTAYPKASPVAEGELKGQGSVTYVAASEKVRTLAVWIPASKQAIADLAGLQESVNVHLLGSLLDEEDAQILSGDAIGENLNGLNHQATSFDTSLLAPSDGWEFADILGWAIAQLATSNYMATAIVLHPLDFWKIRLCKTSTGQYLFGDPSQMAETRLFGLPVAVTAAQAQGTFTLGDFSTGAALHVRVDGIVEVSDSHADYFVRNMLAIRAEERVALCVYKPSSIITGSFSQSPA
jgi:HK97 family phage major capsid protein